jgi:hypothetical protein
VGDKGPASDRRLKKNFLEIDNSLENVLKLRGVEFLWKDFIYPNTIPNVSDLGFIAQEVQEIFPELVTKDNEGLLRVKYGNMLAIIVDAIQKQNEIIQQKESELIKLESIAKEKGLI